MTHRAVPTLPPLAAPLSPTRRVRVVIEGDARTLAHNPDLLRVFYGAASSVMVNAAELGVSIEDLGHECGRDFDPSCDGCRAVHLDAGGE